DYCGLTHTQRQPVRVSKLFSRKSESVPQGNKYFHRDFAGHSYNRKAHASKEAIKTCERNIKYNIGPDGDEGISQGSAQDDSTAPLLALAGGNALSQGVHCALQPAMIDVGDDRSRQKSRSHRPAEEHQAHHQSHSRRRDHVSADTLQRSSKKFVRCRGGGFKHRGHTSMYRADRSRVVDDLQFAATMGPACRAWRPTPGCSPLHVP